MMVKLMARMSSPYILFRNQVSIEKSIDVASSIEEDGTCPNRDCPKNEMTTQPTMAALSVT